MSLQLTVSDVDASGTLITVYGSVAFSGNYATGGDGLNWTTIASQIGNQGQGVAANMNTTNGPIQCFFDSQNAGSGGSNGGYYEPVKGSAANSWKLACYQPGGSEVSAGAYPSGVTSDIVIFQATFRKLQ